MPLPGAQDPGCCTMRIPPSPGDGSCTMAVNPMSSAHFLVLAWGLGCAELGAPAEYGTPADLPDAAILERHPPFQAVASANLPCGADLRPAVCEAMCQLEIPEDCPWGRDHGGHGRMEHGVRESGELDPVRFRFWRRAPASRELQIWEHGPEGCPARLTWQGPEAGAPDEVKAQLPTTPNPGRPDMADPDPLLAWPGWKARHLIEARPTDLQSLPSWSARVAGLLAHPDAQVRVAALSSALYDLPALGTREFRKADQALIAHRATWGDAIARGLADASPHVRAQALQVAPAHAGPEELAVLAGMRCDPAAGVREMAIRVFGADLPRARLAEALLDPDRRVAQTAGQHWDRGPHGDPSWTAALAELGPCPEGPHYQVELSSPALVEGPVEVRLVDETGESRATGTVAAHPDGRGTLVLAPTQPPVLAVLTANGQTEWHRVSAAWGQRIYAFCDGEEAGSPVCEDRCVTRLEWALR